MTHHVRRYEGWGSFLEAALGPSDIPDYQRRGGSQSDLDDWAGGTWNEVLEAATNGWATVQPEIERITEKIKDEVRPLLSTTFRSDFDVAGAAVDIGRFLEGEPEYMVQLTPIKIAKPGRVISILVDISHTATVSPDALVRRGAAICALIEVLELLQHSTELWVERTSSPSRSRGGQHHTTLVKIKGAEDKLDTGLIAFTLAHPGMLRRICFAHEETEPGHIRELYGFNGGSYGIPAKVTQEKAVQATLVLHKTDHTMNDDPTGWIRKHLVEFALLAPAPVD